MPILLVVNFTRVSFFLPFIWMVAFAVSIATFSAKCRYLGGILAGVLIFSQLGVSLLAHEYLTVKYTEKISFAKFYSEAL